MVYLTVEGGIQVSDQVRQIAQRVKELREISDLTVAEVASKVELSPEEYEAYESGRVDMSISLLIKLSELYGVDTTTLLTGQAPRLSVCALTRRNMGTTVKRAKHYIYKNLAYNFNHRKISPSSPAPMPIWRPTATRATNSTTCSRARCASRSAIRT